MQKRRCLLLMFVSLVFFTGCVGVPAAEIMLETYPHHTDFSADAGILKVYFPSFTDSSWSEENRYVIGGDGTVIILPNDEVMVIDGFYSAASAQYTDFIKSLGITHIDYLVLTHFHGDHSGSFPELIKTFNVDIIYTNGAYTDTAPTKELLDCIKENDVTEVVIKEGDFFTVGDCDITVYSPSLSEEDLYNVFNNPGKTAKMINNTSLVFKLEYGNFSILFSGDVYKGQDRKIVRKYGNELKSTLLKVPHHGEFYTANSGTFASVVQPEYGIVMDNRYVSTMGSVISNKYFAYGGHILFRDDAGYILAESDGNSYSLSLESF